MESLRRAFFEDPLYAYIALAFAELVLAAIWHETRNRKWLAALAGPVVLAVAVWAVATLVVTDREQILEATHRIAREAEAGSVAAAEEFLDDGYRGYGLNKAGVLGVGRGFLAAYRVQRVGFTRLEVTVNGDEAALHAGTIITIEGGKAAVAWDVRWAKRPAGWRIVEVAPPQSKLEL